MSELVARLGLDPGARAVVVTADDLGLCFASTEGTLEALRAGMATSAGLLVAAPWAREAAARAAGFDVGVQLALTAELPRYRWGPITFAPTLLGGDGGFPATVQDLHDHADPDEVRRECRAQLERAVLYGVTPTHLSVRDGALFGAPALFDVLLELATESRLPLRLPDRESASRFGFPLHELARDAGVVHTDEVTTSSEALGDPERFAATLAPGVTELVVRPSLDSDELRALAPDAQRRVDDLDQLVGFGRLRDALSHAGVTTLAWGELQALVASSPIPER
jgi:predicted glycoside hydrolase/deacetylase ChbG (UPF0249 family)